MATITPEDRFLPDPALPYQPDISRGMFRRVFEQAGSPWAALADEAYDLIVEYEQFPGRWLAICDEEHSLALNRDSVLWQDDTRSWTNARSVRLPRLRYVRPEAFRADPDTYTIVEAKKNGTPYVRYASVLDSLEDGLFRVVDPEYRYATEGRVTIAAVIGIWTEGDWQRYAAAVCADLNRWIAADGGNVIVGTPYDHIIRGLIDARSQLETRRPNEGGVPRGPYETVPLARKRGVVVHYRGVVTAADAGLASFQADAVYHVGKNWARAGENPVYGSGIMYHVGIDGQGRKHLLRDLDRVLWHCGAWPQNADTLAIQLALGGPQRATEVQLQSLREVVDDWCAFSHTPRDEVWGHQQLSQTDCPGTLMRDFVTPYRASAPPSPPASVPRVPPTMPDPWRHEAGGNRYGEFWVAAPFVQWINAHGGFWAMGHVVAGAFEAEDTGIYTQPFEGGMLEWHPDNPPEYRVLRRHCGVEVMRERFPQHAPWLKAGA